MASDFDFAKKLQDGSLKVQFKSQVSDMLKMTLIHEFKIKVIIPVVPNTFQGVNL